MVRVQRDDVVEHRPGGRDLRVVGSGRIQPLVRNIVVEEVALVRQLVEEPVADDHQALVDRVRLVQAEQIHVGIERGDVGQGVRHERDAVDDHPRTDRVRHRGDAGDVVLLPDDVRGVRNRHERRAIVDQRGELVDVEQAGGGVGAPLADRATDPFGGAPDGAGVRLVVLVGDDHDVVRTESGRERLRQHVGVHRGRRAEHDLAGRHPERFGPPFARPVHRVAGRGRRRVLGVRLHLGGGVVVRQGIDGLAAGERPSGVLEERLARSSTAKAGNCRRTKSRSRATCTWIDWRRQIADVAVRPAATAVDVSGTTEPMPAAGNALVTKLGVVAVSGDRRASVEVRARVVWRRERRTTLPT